MPLLLLKTIPLKRSCSLPRTDTVISQFRRCIVDIYYLHSCSSPRERSSINIKSRILRRKGGHSRIGSMKGRRDGRADSKAGRNKGRADSITGKRDRSADSNYQRGHLCSHLDCGRGPGPSLRCFARMQGEWGCRRRRWSSSR